VTKPALRTSTGKLRVLADRTGRAAQLAYFALFNGPRGRGRPAPAARWEAQWRQGQWDYLVSEEELPRYAVIAGYIRSVTPAPVVLDVGCGHGQLLTALGDGAVAGYHGIDISGEAISRARALPIADATFEVADLTRWEAPSPYDVVVINEVLYYIDEPCAAVARYRARLRRDGMLIISMFRHGNTRLIWRNLGRQFPLMGAAEVKNRLGEIVDVKILGAG
jgi:2-polyprenyl-3-methyl-5-hydroxy-6-metoxy-1,4-benzoquinol methylase